MKTTKQILNQSSDASSVWLLGGFGYLGQFSVDTPAGGMFSSGHTSAAGERRPVSSDRLCRLNPGRITPTLG